MNATKKTIMNANLFSRLFDGLDNPARLAIEMLDGKRISYGDLIALAGQTANVLVAAGVLTAWLLLSARKVSAPVTAPTAASESRSRSPQRTRRITVFSRNAQLVFSRKAQEHGEQRRN